MENIKDIIEKIELNKSELVVLAGRPATGKTSISLEVAANVLAKENTGVAIFNLEMSADWCKNRIFCSDAFTDKDGLVINNLYICDKPGISVEEIREKSFRLKEEKDLGLIVIDYFQLLESKTLSDTKENYKAISSSLKALAQELDVCILVLSHLSKPKHREPTLKDLNLSKCLIDDASSIFFLNRDSHNNFEILNMKRSKN